MDIKQLIDNDSLTVYFQQIISINRKMVCGLEGLIRGYDQATDSIIMPKDIFDCATMSGMTLELDRHCRDLVLQKFAPIFKRYPDKMLFLNIDASILDHVKDSNYLYDQVMEQGINPSNIVIEINELNVQDIHALQRFSEKYRSYGFLIALDDVGHSFSNIDRILQVKPDIIKIDRSIIHNINQEFSKQSAFVSLIELSRSIGSVVIAEGIESGEEVFQVLQLGVKMIQGFYFSRPKPINELSNAFVNQKIISAYEYFNYNIAQSVKSEQERSKLYLEKSVQATRSLEKVKAETFNNRLLHLVWNSHEVESAYVINESGIQVGNTIMNHDMSNLEKSLIFYSANDGADHSMDKYYYTLARSDLISSITEPYVSMATGRLCLTVSRKFTNCENDNFILCLDYKLDLPSAEYPMTNNAKHVNAYTSFNGKTTTKIDNFLLHSNSAVYLDELTGAYNRRYINEKLIVEMITAFNENRPFSVIMADLDYFKRINDQFGHLAGDSVLREFVRIVKLNIRNQCDWIARYGGEEFLIVMPGATADCTYSKAEKIRRELQNMILFCEGQAIHCTASFGTYTVENERMSIENMLKSVDKNLYTAKKSGRNLTCTGNA